MEDVMLAIQAKTTTSFVTPPSQDALQAMADRRNKAALPTLATKHGFRLPPPEDCLIAPNFQFHPRSVPEQMDWEEDSLPSGVGTEPTSAPPARPLKSRIHDVREQHPAFREESSVGDELLSDTGASNAAKETPEQAVINMQS